MNLIEYLKLKEYKGITEKIILKDLGRINIICGKNNSGKSSILEAINNHDKRSYGIKITEEIIEELLNKPMSKYAPPGSTGLFKNLFSFLSDVITFFVREREEKVLFSDECAALQVLFKQRFDKNPNYRKYSSLVGVLGSKFRELFAQYEENIPLLIPPKRKIQEKAAINETKDVQPSGEGILKKLFIWQTQKSSGLEKRFIEYRRDFNTISGDWDFNIDATNTEINLNFMYAGGRWRKSQECGLGLQDLMVVLYFLKESGIKVVCIEEPENHMHPEMQRRLLHFIKQSVTDRQIFIPTFNLEVQQKGKLLRVEF